MTGSLRLGRTLCLGVALATPCSPALADGLGVDLEVEAVSAYVFRGAVLNPDPALQPALTLSSGPLAFAAWASLNLTDELGRAGDVGEIDLTLSYAFERGPVSVALGVGHYRYRTPEAGHTTELVVDLSLATVVEPRIALAYDVDAADGLYGRVAVGLPIELTGDLGLDLEAGLGWGSAAVNSYNFEVDRDAPADATLAVHLEGRLGNASWWTRLVYSWMTENDLEASAREIYGDAELLVGVLGVSWNLAGPTD